MEICGPKLSSVCLLLSCFVSPYNRPQLTATWSHSALARKKLWKKNRKKNTHHLAWYLRGKKLNVQRCKVKNTVFCKYWCLGPVVPSFQMATPHPVVGHEIYVKKQVCTVVILRQQSTFKHMQHRCCQQWAMAACPLGEGLLLTSV